MADLFSAIGTAVSGLRVTQGGIAVTGHNVANVNTPGYSRQRAVVEASRPIGSPNGSIGTGAEQADVVRITDVFVERQLVQERSAAGSLDAQARALSHVGALLNEQETEGIASALSDFYRSFEDVANSPEPGQPTERESVLGAARALVTTVQRADRELRELQRGTDRDVVSLLDGINSLASRIAELNGQILARSGSGTDLPNDLIDQRDQLVRELAEKVEIQTFEQPGEAMVVLVGNGMPLVEGVYAARLEARTDPGNPFDPSFSQIHFVGRGNDLDLSLDIGGGQLGGLLRARDTLVADAIRALDVLAFNVTQSVNEQHRLGLGLDGVGGRDFFTPPASIEDAARNLALDAAVAGAGGAQRIAAAGGTGSGLESDNENARALAQLATTRAPTWLLGDPLPPGAPSGPTASAIELTASLLSDVGRELRNVQQAQSQQRGLVEELESRRDEISGVSLDEEMTNLIRLEAAFQANARVLSTVDELLQQLVAIL